MFSHSSVFMSHTKLDKKFCDRFDIAAARVGIIVFRSEFEKIEPPAWKTIKNKMSRSSAMFLLVGKELVKAQETSGLDHTLRDSWKYTQNWIAYEVGLACQRGLDVWVVCDNVEINFPVPYLSNYSVGGLYSSDEDETGIGFMREILENYKRGSRFLLGALKRNISCPNDDCKAMFNLHSVIPKGGTVVCPTCLQTMTFDGGWLIK